MTIERAPIGLRRIKVRPDEYEKALEASKPIRTRLRVLTEDEDTTVLEATSYVIKTEAMRYMARKLSVGHYQGDLLVDGETYEFLCIENQARIPNWAPEIKRVEVKGEEVFCVRTTSSDILNSSTAICRTLQARIGCPSVINLTRNTAPYVILAIGRANPFSDPGNVILSPLRTRIYGENDRIDLEEEEELPTAEAVIEDSVEEAIEEAVDEDLMEIDDVYDAIVLPEDNTAQQQQQQHRTLTGPLFPEPRTLLGGAAPWKYTPPSPRPVLPPLPVHIPQRDLIQPVSGRVYSTEELVKLYGTFLNNPYWITSGITDKLLGIPINGI